MANRKEEKMGKDTRLADIDVSCKTVWEEITEDELNNIVEQYNEIARTRVQEEETRDQRLAPYIRLIEQAFSDYEYELAGDQNTCIARICNIGLDEHGPEIMEESWDLYFQKNKERAENYRDLVKLLRTAKHENERSRIHLIKTVYENEGRTRSVMKKLTLCKYHCYKGNVGKINPGGGGYAADCLANKYGFCDHQHVGDPDWDYAVNLARKNGANLTFPSQPKTVATGQFVGAGAGSQNQNNRQENRVWATTTVASNSAEGNAHRDRSYNKTTQVVGGASSTTTTTSSSGGAGNGNRMQQQTQQKKKDKGKSGFAALREESSEEED